MRIHSSQNQNTYQLMAKINWSNHSLGPMEKWDSVLVHTLNFIFNSHQPTFVFWGKDAFCFYNDGYIPILGLSKHPEAMGSPAEKVWNEIWTLDTNPQFLSAMEGTPTWNVDRMVPIERDGRIEEAYFTYGYSPLYLDNGKVNGVIVTALETTKSVYHKREIENTAEKLSRALEVMNIGFYDWDMETDFVAFNQKMQKDWGYPAGANISEVITHIHPDDQERVRQTIEKAIAEKTPYQCTYRVLSNGAYEWLDVRGVITYRDDKAVRFFGTSLVITERIQGEEKLKQSAKELVVERLKLEAIFEAAPAALAFWAGEDMVFDKVNPEYQKIFPGRKLQGLPLLEAVPELKGQGFFELLQKVLHTGEPFIGKEILAMIPDINGKLQEKYYDFSYLQILDVEGKPAGVFDHAIDVTERVKATREREEEKLIREKFVAALTHDLRTPLTAAKISAQLLFKTDDSLQKQKLLTRVVQNIDRSDDMIRDLLDANRMKAGESIPVEKKPLELKSYLTGVVDEISSIHGARFKLVANEEIRGSWDANAILRIMENLISNAIKYGDNSLIVIELKKVDHSALISVGNRGPLITKEDQMKIFSAYHRTADAHKSLQKGWGIGLSLVQALAHAHNGMVTVQSTQETGTIFTVTLPL